MLETGLHRGRTHLLIVLWAGSCIGIAQSQSFETVVIKPNSGSSPGVRWGVNETGYVASNVPLARVILDAYLSPTNSTVRPPLDRVKEGPAWVTTSLYDITAKADEATIAAMKGMNQGQQLALEAPMLRAMLQDRFKLTAHVARVEVQGYALVVGKHGMKMKESPPNEVMPANAMGFGGVWKMVQRRAPDGKQLGIAYLGITMAELASFLGSGTIPVVDQTGLTARYDVELQSIDSDAPGDGSPAPRPDIAHAYEWGAIGLEMKPTKAPVMSVVIDHVERPTAN
jgi:bla regulator protein BlaR1